VKDILLYLSTTQFCRWQIFNQNMAKFYGISLQPSTSQLLSAVICKWTLPCISNKIRHLFLKLQLHASKSSRYIDIYSRNRLEIGVVRHWFVEKQFFQFVLLGLEAVLCWVAMVDTTRLERESNLSGISLGETSDESGMGIRIFKAGYGHKSLPFTYGQNTAVVLRLPLQLMHCL
jgi:hypothetical protein